MTTGVNKTIINKRIFSSADTLIIGPVDEEYDTETPTAKSY
jgi:hypothetical protein